MSLILVNRITAEERVVECQAHIERMRAQVRDDADKLQSERDEHASKIQQANQRLAKAMSLIKEEKQTAQEKNDLASEVFIHSLC
jgi:seryl-tRNA synthetase